jgi:hypothetical protein
MTHELQVHKSYPIDSIAQAEHGGTRAGWRAQGTVFEPLKPMLIRGGKEYHPGLIELKRLCSGADLFFASKEDAEEFGLIMCRAWIDGLPE